jgi:hypothetical protein
MGLQPPSPTDVIGEVQTWSALANIALNLLQEVAGDFSPQNLGFQVLLADALQRTDRPMESLKCLETISHVVRDHDFLHLAVLGVAAALGREGGYEAVARRAVAAVRARLDGGFGDPEGRLQSSAILAFYLAGVGHHGEACEELDRALQIQTGIDLERELPVGAGLVSRKAALLCAKAASACALGRWRVASACFTAARQLSPSVFDYLDGSREGWELAQTAVLEGQ